MKQGARSKNTLPAKRRGMIRSKTFVHNRSGEVGAAKDPGGRATKNGVHRPSWLFCTRWKSVPPNRLILIRRGYHILYHPWWLVPTVVWYGTRSARCQGMRTYAVFR